MFLIPNRFERRRPRSRLNQWHRVRPTLNTTGCWRDFLPSLVYLGRILCNNNNNKRMIGTVYNYQFITDMKRFTHIKTNLFKQVFYCFLWNISFKKKCLFTCKHIMYNMTQLFLYYIFLNDLYESKLLYVEI